MLTKTKITSIAVVMIAFASIAGITQIQDVESSNTQKILTPTNIPMPPPILFGNYGLVEDITKVTSEGFSIKTMNSDSVPELNLLETRKSHGGYVTLFYAPDGVKQSSEAPVIDFIKSGGVVVIFSEIGENFDVDAKISSYVERPGNEDLSFKINGDRAYGVLKNVEFNMPAKIHIYQDDGTLVTLLGWQSISELQRIAGALQ
jgi:hypothetical protein